MALHSLKSTIMFAVSVFVTLPVLVVSQLVAHRYAEGLKQLTIARAENVVHSLALEAADKILLQDRVSLQKLLDEPVGTSGIASYAFIVREGEVMVHTFADAVPVELVEANVAENASDRPRIIGIVSETGQRYIDIAYPIFDGKAGILRMGFSETPLQKQVDRLWWEITGLSLVILALTLLLSQYILGRLIRSLADLTRFAETIDVEHPPPKVIIEGKTEILRLAESFNALLDRLSQYNRTIRERSRQLEEKNRELERAHRQLALSCSFVQQISALSGIDAIGSFLIRTLREATSCNRVQLLMLDIQNRIVHRITEEERFECDRTAYDSVEAFLDRCNEPQFLTISDVESISIPQISTGVDPIALFPIRHQQLLIGGLLVTCDRDCPCMHQEVEVIAMILNQAAGALQRACIQEGELRAMRQRLDVEAGLGEIVGKDPRMQALFRLIEDVAPTDATVLIQGESGTGKELVARAIHNRSSRADRPFVVINCSAYPSTLLESELFGHEKGAFTGAVRRKIGRFEQANGGTVFLDEIGEIEPMAQTRLLRALQQQTIDRLGGDRPIKVDVRILAATNRNLLQAVRDGRFREDLYYRLNVVPIQVPPLRERKKDIHLLARHFLERFASEQGKVIRGFRSEVLRRLFEHSWPGNVRELENTIEHAVVLAKTDWIEMADLPASLIDIATDSTCNILTITEIEKQTIRNALEDNDWNKTETARKLGISRSTLYEKMKRFRIVPPSSASS